MVNKIEIFRIDEDLGNGSGLHLSNQELELVLQSLMYTLQKVLGKQYYPDKYLVEREQQIKSLISKINMSFM